MSQAKGSQRSVPPALKGGPAASREHNPGPPNPIEKPPGSMLPSRRASPSAKPLRSKITAHWRRMNLIKSPGGPRASRFLRRPPIRAKYLRSGSTCDESTRNFNGEIMSKTNDTPRFAALEDHHALADSELDVVSGGIGVRGYAR